MKTKRRRARIVVVVLTVLLFVLVCDMVARQHLIDARPLHVADPKVYVQQSPAAYAASPYYTPEFIAELWRDHESLSDTGVWLPDDRSSTYFNVENGFRRTVGQPTRYAHTVWLLGSSTTQDIYVPDAYTMASYLQRMLPGTRVMNAGVSGATFDLQYFRLRTLPIHPGDTVIMYSGAIEAITIYDSAVKKRDDSLPFFCGWWISLTYDLCQTHTLSPDFEQAEIQEEYVTYKAAIDNARNYSLSRGATFFAFLQPMMFTAPLSESDKRLFGAYYYAKVMPDTYAAFRALPLVDISHALDSARQKGSQVYIDSVHVADAGNEIIASVIARYLMTSTF